MKNIAPHIEKHIISKQSTVRQALIKLDQLGSDAILFVTDDSLKLTGTLTDGDVRRGLIKGYNIENIVMEFIQPNPIFIQKNNYDLIRIKEHRDKNIKLIPIVNHEGEIVNIINLRLIKSYLPLDAVLFAGGEGKRLRPLTEHTPKPLLMVGEKPIIEYNIDWMASFGIDDFWITLRYLGYQIKEFLGNGEKKQINIRYYEEIDPLGTIGALAMIDNFQHDSVLVINSDILTNIDYEDFFLSFKESNADISVATIPYHVDIPYAVLETENGKVKSLKEKPRYTYFSNAGIYLIKKELISSIPKGVFFNATDLLEYTIENKGMVHSYPIRSYWLDIGKHDDYQKAQEDIKHIKLL
jgi:dTDP-glucose pyrophosphorylase